MNPAIITAPRADAASADLQEKAASALGMALQALNIEVAAVQQLHDRLAADGTALVRAVTIMQACGGRVVVMGMGKSGHVGRKIAATLSSTGTPALFVHPAEASHGDLGMITPADVVVGISNSGESEELVTLLPLIKRLGVPLLAMTGRAASTLGRHADVLLDTSVAQEACPHNLAPTASTIVQMALGDALAVALLDARGFRAEDFARSHPGGALGRRLLTHVRDIMRPLGEAPQVGPQATFDELMRSMTRSGMGMSAVVDEAGKVLGVFTDGDLRRQISAGRELRTLQARDVMTPSPVCIDADVLAVQAAELMEARRITSLLVVDAQGILAGAVNTNDLMRVKVI